MTRFFLSSIISCILTNSLMAGVTLIDLPPKGNIIDLSKLKYIQDELDKLFKGTLSRDPSNRITYISPDEAKYELSSYVKKKYGAEEGKHFIDKFFNKEYFGEEIIPEQKTPIEIAKEDPYLLNHIYNVLRNKPPSANIPTLKEAMKMWLPTTLLLTPEDVFNACVAKPSCKQELPIHNFEKYKKQFPDKAERIFSEEYFIPQDPSKQKDFFLHNPLGFFSQSLVKNIYEVAKKIMNATKQGDYIIIFGNTPYFVGRALQKLVSRDSANQNYRVIIEFPFSGSPNRIRPGHSYDLRNIVTEDRLYELTQRLEKNGLSPKNKQLQDHSVYFVDVIASGSGLAYVIEELLRKFTQSRQKQPIPDFNIISLNKLDITNEEDRRNASIANKNAGDGEHITLFLPNKHKPHFSIDSQVIDLEGHGQLDNLPSNDLRVWPEFNASYWQPEYAYLLTRPKSKIIETLFNFFDANIEYLMQNDQKLKAD